MRVVVSGASGFIGSHLARALSARGDEVVALGRHRPEATVAAYCPCDVRSPEAREAAAGAAAIVHLAALSDASLSLRDPLAYFEVNALGTANLLEVARANGAVFILASTQRVYRPGSRPLAEDSPLAPAEPYGYAKLLAETWVAMHRQVYGLPAITLRFFSVYGPGQDKPGGTSGVAAILLHRALAGEDIWVDGAKRRDLTYVSDVVDGILAALDRGARCRPVYNIATGEGTTLAELAQVVLSVTGSRSRLTIQEGGPVDDLVADISLAREDLGYRPKVGLREGITRTYEWLRGR